MVLRELGFDLFEGFFLDLVTIARRKHVAMVA